MAPSSVCDAGLHMVKGGGLKGRAQHRGGSSTSLHPRQQGCGHGHAALDTHPMSVYSTARGPAVSVA
eukprot:4110615-Prymnesium_polylepis.1